MGINLGLIFASLLALAGLLIIIVERKDRLKQFEP